MEGTLRGTNDFTGDTKEYKSVQTIWVTGRVIISPTHIYCIWKAWKTNNFIGGIKEYKKGQENPNQHNRGVLLLMAEGGRYKNFKASAMYLVQKKYNNLILKFSSFTQWGAGVEKRN